MVECFLAKEDVASSSLVSRSILNKSPRGSFLVRFQDFAKAKNRGNFGQKGTVLGPGNFFVDFNRVLRILT